MNVNDLKIKLFADGADLAGILKMAELPYIKGFTTNPTLMRKAGVSDYAAFARQVLDVVTDRPISFEVFSDEIDEMERQAHLISKWANNVYVKIPVTNTRREPTYELIRKLSNDGVKLNVTAVMTIEQVRAIASALNAEVASVVSVFAGRFADTGCDPMPLMAEANAMLRGKPNAELLWASPRELLNIIQADQVGCHIITATNDILGKLKLLGKDLGDFSLETVKMFYDDAQAAGYQL
jgi:transaldolase